MVSAFGTPTGKLISVSVRVVCDVSCVRAGEAKLRGSVSAATFRVARAPRGNFWRRRRDAATARPVLGDPGAGAAGG